jgi:DNA-directed RNA polymerase subunit RPC12/RpoP
MANNNEHTHEYDCIVCGAHFDDQQTLAKHNDREHISKATGMERPRQDARDEIPFNDRLDPKQQL